jgi:site-specific DNA-methyltransferase (adenine-specific)
MVPDYNIWDFYVGGGNTTNDKVAFNHPAIFPEELVKRHIESWSNEGDLVYDPFMGSGTTSKMSILLNRNYVGSELSYEYCKIEEERIKKLK